MGRLLELVSRSRHLSCAKGLFMLSLDQIQRELKAIEDFDFLFSAASEHRPEEIVGFELRRLREQELRAQLASREAEQARE